MVINETTKLRSSHTAEKFVWHFNMTNILVLEFDSAFLWSVALPPLNYLLKLNKERYHKQIDLRLKMLKFKNFVQC